MIGVSLIYGRKLLQNQNQNDGARQGLQTHVEHEGGPVCMYS